MTLRRLVGAVALALTVALLAACTDEDTSWPAEQDTIVIATGNPAGVYAGYGEQIGRAIERRTGAEVRVLPSGGSIDNLQHLAAGEADLAFSAVDAAADAAAGRGVFDEPVPVRTLARVYDDFAHLVVAADSDLRSIEDLRGRPVAIGARDSGTALIAGRLFRAAGMQTSDVDARALSLDDSIKALRTDRIDALFWSGGLGTPSLADFADGFPVRLLPLAELVDPVRSEFGSGYRHGTLPGGTYGSAEEVDTLAVPNVLVVRADASPDLTYAQLDIVFDAQHEIAEEVSAASLLDRAKAIFTDPVKLHPGAVRYYRDAAR